MSIGVGLFAADIVLATILGIIFLLVFSQLLYPLWRGRLTFPMLRSNAVLEHELAKAYEGQDEVQLRRRIKQIRRGGI